jgi:hypothetical protein
MHAENRLSISLLLVCKRLENSSMALADSKNINKCTSGAIIIIDHDQLPRDQQY